MVPRWFRAGSALVPRWFRVGSALVPRRFRVGSASVPRWFRVASALVPRRFRVGSASVHGGVPASLRVGPRRCPRQCEGSRVCPRGSGRAPVGVRVSVGSCVSGLVRASLHICMGCRGLVCVCVGWDGRLKSAHWGRDHHALQGWVGGFASVPASNHNSKSQWALPEPQPRAPDLSRYMPGFNSELQRSVVGTAGP